MSKNRLQTWTDRLSTPFASSTLIAILSLASIAFISYKDILGYFFTFEDSLLLIQRSKVQSFHDILKILSGSILPAHSFMKFYRPLSVLSFSVDYSLWGINPFGYHLTNMILHIMVSISVFFVVRSLTKNHFATAWLSAVIFTTHPVLFENVPGISTRQDIMAALFLLLSLLFFLKNISSKTPLKRNIFASLFFYILALGSKEIAIILLPLILAYYIIFGEDKKIAKAFLKSLPYTILTLIYIAWRAYVLHGVGGYAPSLKDIFNGPFIRKLVFVIEEYFLSLTYPVHILHSEFYINPYSNTLKGICSPDRMCLLLFLSAIFLCLSSFYFFKRADSTKKKVLSFLVVWLALPLIVYMINLLYVRRYAYISVIPYSAFISIIIVEGLRHIFSRIMEQGPRASILRHLKMGFCFLMMVGLSLYLLLYSPLVRTYKQWEHAANIEKALLCKVTENIPQLPDNAVIHITNIPKEVYYENWISPVKDFYVLNIGKFRAWADLNYPNNKVNIFAQFSDAILVKKYPCSLDDANSDIKSVRIFITRDGNYLNGSQ